MLVIHASKDILHQIIYPVHLAIPIYAHGVMVLLSKIVLRANIIGVLLDYVALSNAVIVLVQQVLVQDVFMDNIYRIFLIYSIKN